MSPEQASARRDFTINAMLYDPEADRVLDFFGGLDDLERKQLRHTSPAFADDPLRVLRGMQFAGRFGLTAERETLELSRRLFAEHDTLATERVWGEWAKWAAKSTVPSAGLRYLAACGWRAAHPELTALDGCPQEPEWHPEGDVWTHTLLVCDAVARIAERDGLDADSRTVLGLAALCHDLGKPQTTIRTDGRVRSPGHATHLAPTENFLTRIGCPERIARRVVGLTRHHLAHMDFAGSARHVRRLSRALGEEGETIETLARLVEADHGGRPPLPGGMPEPMSAMLELARELSTAAAAPTRLLLGRHLIELGVEPGPQMGRLLDAAYEAQLDGAFDSLDGARAWVAARL
jgi:tRNA nucleotidyltransferase (CCA-adding enzyme)